MHSDRSRPYRTGFARFHRGRLSALAGALALLGLTAPAPAQDRPFWDQNDAYGDRRAAPSGRASAKRDDSYRPPDDLTAPPGGFGQQAGQDGRPYDSQRPYSAPPNSGPYGTPVSPPGSPPGGYANGPAYDPRYDQPARAPQGYGAAPASPEYAAPAAPAYGEQRQAESWRGAPRDDVYRPDGGPAYSDNRGGYSGNQPYQQQPGYPAGPQPDPGGYGQPYSPPPGQRGPAYGQDYPPDGRASAYNERGGEPGAYSQNEVVNAGHQFFGSISQGLARAVEQVFKSQGRPNGYILGEDAGGAFVAGLRYGEGTLYTKDVGNHRVFWQGPSLGYDFGGEGSKTMVLVYNLRDPHEMFERFGGVQGSAYLIGGVSVQFQTREHVTLAVIRSGVGLRLGANVGYLKYTRRPTWNPF